MLKRSARKFHRSEGSMTRIPILWIAAFVMAWCINVASAQSDDLLSQVRSLRLSGQLVEAQVLAEEALSKSGTPFDRVKLHLEIARILDRVGLILAHHRCHQRYW